MKNREHFWRLEHLSDRQLLERLQGVLCTQRSTLAELVAHLGEVEERRLHLAAAHGSMFSYCVHRLGMSEDEACRRIDLARLARRFPVLFGELASGRISLSVALLLKPLLTLDNHAELIAAARGASLRTARELLAARFPSPDVPSRIRKLPERVVANAIPVAVDEVANAIPVAVDEVVSVNAAAVDEVANARSAAAGDGMPACVTTPGGTIGTTTTPTPSSSSPPPPRLPAFELGSHEGAQSLLQAPHTPAAPSPAPAQTAPPRHADPRPHQRIDPLSVERYRIVFTADASLKKKLELARNLLRHSHPSGDFALIVSRALDLLLEELLQSRFGARRKDAPQRARGAGSRAASEEAAAPATSAPAATPPTSAPAATPPASASPIATPRSTPSVALQVTVPSPIRPLATPSVTTASVVAGKTPTSRIARPARRAVLERDGLGCCWVDAEGHRCGSTAWLEHDHRHPAGKGGSSKPENLRQLCRAHNRFAAERAYGRDHIERAIQTRQRNRERRSQNGQPPSSSPAPA